MDNLPASREEKWTPSSEVQQERIEHRRWIGGRALTLLSHYWREDDDEMLTAAIGQDWADVLEGIPQEFIRKACVRYAREEPRRKPTPGAIYQMAREAMPSLRVVPERVDPPVEQREPCDPEVAQKLCEEAGYTPKRFGGDT